MARTSKTVIGGDSGPQNDRMVRAAASGAEAVAQAHGQLMGQYEKGADRAQQQGQIASGLVERQEERDTQKEQFQSKMAQDSAQFNQKMQQDESQFSRTMDQRQSETNLEGAKAGFEQGAEEPTDERQAKLEEEMRKGQGQPQIGPLEPDAQERLSDSVNQRLEMDGHGKWRPTQERKEEKARDQTRADFRADTERTRAMAYRDQVAVSAQKALAAGDKEAYDEHAKTLAKTPNDMQKRFDRLVKGQVHDTDWSEMSDLAKGSEEVDPTLMTDIKAQNFTPRVAAFVRAQVQKDALMSIALSKGSTSHLNVDWTAPKMREFQTEVVNMNDFMKANPALGQLGFIQSTEDKMRFLNTMAAARVLTGMSSTPGSPSGGMTPATSPDQAGGGAPGSEQMVPPGGTQVPGRAQGAAAVRGARAGGATPGQALEAGQKANPTSRFGEAPPRSPYEDVRRHGL